MIRKHVLDCQFCLSGQVRIEVTSYGRDLGEHVKHLHLVGEGGDETEEPCAGYREVESVDEGEK